MLRLSTPRCVPLCLLLLGAASCTSPQSEPEEWRVSPLVREGGRVIGFSGSYALRRGERDREWLSARATIEEFITDRQAVGGFILGQFVNRSENVDGEEQLWIGGQYRLHHHFDERASIYAGPSIGMAYFDDPTASGTAFAWGVSAGIRYWLTPRTAFTFEPTYLRAEFGDEDGGPTDDVLFLWGFAFSI